jgi:hypothetical protein
MVQEASEDVVEHSRDPAAMRDFRASVEIPRADKMSQTLLWRQRDEVVGAEAAWSFSDTTASARRDPVFH